MEGCVFPTYLGDHSLSRRKSSFISSLQTVEPLSLFFYPHEAIYYTLSFLFRWPIELYQETWSVFQVRTLQAMVDHHNLDPEDWTKHLDRTQLTSRGREHNTVAFKEWNCLVLNHKMRDIDLPIMKSPIKLSARDDKKNIQGGRDIFCITSAAYWLMLLK